VSEGELSKFIFFDNFFILNSIYIKYSKLQQMQHVSIVAWGHMNDLHFFKKGVVKISKEKAQMI